MAAEDLNFIVNKYLASEIDVVHYFGGDIILFAGDAMLVVFPDGTKEADSFTRATSGPEQRGQQLCAQKAMDCACALMEISKAQRSQMPSRLREFGRVGPQRPPHLMFRRWSCISELDTVTSPFCILESPSLARCAS